MNSYLTVDISKDCRLDELLRQQFFFSRHTLYLCKKEGRLVLNGTAVLQDCDLHPGDRLLFYYQKEEPLNCRPIEFDLKILYDDDLILRTEKVHRKIHYMAVVSQEQRDIELLAQIEHHMRSDGDQDYLENA